MIAQDSGLRNSIDKMNAQEQKEEYSRGTLLEFLGNPESYQHQVEQIRHISTHISDIHLTGEFAYKTKKPEKLPFLDYSTIEKRKDCCEQEYELNKRYAPEIYQGVVAITSDKGKLDFNGSGTVIDYAVVMKQFDPDALFLTLLENGELTRRDITDLAREIVRIHKEAPPSPEMGRVDKLWEMIEETTIELKGFAADGFLDRADVTKYEEFIAVEFERNIDLLESRRQKHVKQLHGDLHLGNVCMFNGKPTAFDGIEFNDELSHTDTMMDLSFSYMDLLAHGRKDMATLLVNEYLTFQDDFEGIQIIDMFTAYRFAIRAKVECLAIASAESEEQKEEHIQHAEDLLKHASQVLEKSPPRLIAIGGLSGSGKTTVSSECAPDLEAIHLRTDVVRKHLLGIEITETAAPETYTPEFSRKVYQEVIDRAGELLKLGKNVVVDAVFSKEEERAQIEAVARDAGVPFQGIWCTVSPEEAVRRVSARKGDASDANADVYRKQLTYDLGKLDWTEVNTDDSPEAVSENIIRLLYQSENV